MPFNSFGPILSQSIYSTHKREHISAVGEGEARTLAGDEILPILCYVISHADVICLGVLVELMMGVCDPLVLNGEGGYYLTVLGASLSVSATSELQYIRSVCGQRVGDL